MKLDKTLATLFSLYRLHPALALSRVHDLQSTYERYRFMAITQVNPLCPAPQLGNGRILLQQSFENLYFTTMSTSG